MGPASATAGGVCGSLYLHAPFCARRCPYCDFAVRVNRTPDPAVWVDTLQREMDLNRDDGEFPLGSLETLFVGGGTPSLFGPDVMHRVRELLDSWIPAAGLREWTAEANPESLSEAVAAGWAKAGVDRVSLGVQSFHGPALSWMGRLHGAEGAERAVATARAAGIANVSIDLMFALPAHLGRDWSRDLDRALLLDPDHVSLYGLTVEGGTPLGARVREGTEVAVDEGRYAAEYLEAHSRLVSAGFEHYEVSNFAKPGRFALHNQRYWDGSSYLGLGLGAHSYRHPTRRWNVRSMDDYLRSLGEGRLPVAGEEVLGGEAARLERIWLALRTREGLDVGGFPQSTRILVERWRAAGLAKVDQDQVRLTVTGWLILDELAVSLEATVGGDRPGLAVPGGLGYT